MGTARRSETHGSGGHGATGAALAVKEVEVLAHQLEELGVGRPSTYSSIMKVRARAGSPEA